MQFRNDQSMGTLLFAKERNKKQMELQKSKSLLEKSLEIIDRRKPDSVNPEFNIFTILGLERREVRTHSAFIYELINPEGSHHQEKAFLKLFIQHVLGRDDPCEGPLDVRRENSFEDGRIDFTIQTHLHFYAIEMKIDAGDQPGQLKRYYDHCSTVAQTPFSLYYLTLDGREASDTSTEGRTEYHPIAFKAKEKGDSSVQKWICECRKYLQNDTSPLYFVLSQYGDVIENLTKEYEEDVEIMNLIKNSSDWSAVNELVNARADIAANMLEFLLKSVRMRLEEKCIGEPLKVADEKTIREYCRGNKPYSGYLGISYPIRSKFSAEKSPMQFIVEFGESKLYCMASYRYPDGRVYTRERIEEKPIVNEYVKRFKTLQNPNPKYLEKPASINNAVTFYYNVKVNGIHLHFANIEQLMGRSKLFLSNAWDAERGEFFNPTVLGEVCDAICQSYVELERFLTT